MEYIYLFQVSKVKSLVHYTELGAYEAVVAVEVLRDTDGETVIETNVPVTFHKHGIYPGAREIAALPLPKSGKIELRRRLRNYVKRQRHELTHPEFRMAGVQYEWPS